MKGNFEFNGELKKVMTEKKEYIIHKEALL